MKKQIMALMLVALCGLYGCGAVTTESNAVSQESVDGEGLVEDFKKENIDRTGTIEDYYTNEGNLPITDNFSLYENWDYTEIQPMYLTVRKGNESEGTNHTWAEVNNYSAYYYEELGIDRYMVEGLLQIGDENGPLEGELGYGQYASNATVSVRGQSSTRAAQKNYRITLKDEKGDWNDMAVINLNKHVSDGTRFSNMIAYYWMQQFDGIMADRTKFVHLYVKDETGNNGSEGFKDYGLYTFVEQINKRYLKNHGLDKNGQLYKVNYFEFYEYDDVIVPKNSPDYDLLEFEKYLEVKGNDDHTKLIQMLKEVNDYSIPIETTFSKWFDEENYFTYLAFQILIGNTDTQSRNQFLYSPYNVNKFYFIPWDHDGSMQHTVLEQFIGTNDLGYEIGVSNYWDNVLHRRVIQSKIYREKLDEKVNEVKDFLTREKVTSDAKMFADIVKPYVYSIPDVQYALLSSSQYDYVISHYADEIEQNYRNYFESYNRPMPFYIGAPTINEDVIYVKWDESFDFDAENITYTCSLSDDMYFRSVIDEKETMLTGTEFEMQDPGHYYVKVIATNSSGYSQSAFDYLSLDAEKLFGVVSFWIDNDGNIQMDTLVEE